MIANAVFLVLILAGTLLACVGTAKWVDLEIRRQARGDTAAAVRRWQ